ncbi:MAG: 4-(cytidine 5'-diphospho)-2-C-methyl-D-erythritol kinase [Nitrospinae bacterium]|nr:4-(cytidine 5'-diphospho)-2-C-methyl-D-erythritol kinase [Nitrospinota bacterium]
MFKKLSVASPAKINLVLKVTGKRKDGYHTLATLFQMLELADTLTFSPDPSGRVRVICSDRSIPEKKNLVYRAAQLLWRPGLPGVRIEVKKEIPSGAGLGGGSSNAATALMALNHIWHCRLSPERLRGLAAGLGADVPFFLTAPRAWATGIGDRLTPLPPAADFHILLVKPRVKIPTPMVYRLYDERLTKKPTVLRMNPIFNKKGFLLKDTVRFLENDLEDAVLETWPVVNRIKRELIDSGGKGVMVSGSGSTVFALFSSRREALAAQRALSRRPWWCRVTSPKGDMQHAASFLGGQ